MLLIRHAQMNVMATLAATGFERRMVNHVSRFFPRQCEFIGQSQVESAVQFSIARAESRGFKTCRDLCRYLGVSFLLGSFFDEDPQYPWAAHQTEQAATQKPHDPIGRVYDATMAYLDAAHGKHNQHLIRALLRIRGVVPNELPHFADGEPEASNVDAEKTAAPVHDFLHHYFPQKASRQKSATTALLSSSILASRQFSAATASDPAILLLHQFLLGTGADRDPQFPWVARAFTTNATGVEVCARSVEFIDAILR